MKNINVHTEWKLDKLLFFIYGNGTLNPLNIPNHKKLISGVDFLKE